MQLLLQHRFAMKFHARQIVHPAVHQRVLIDVLLIHPTANLLRSCLPNLYCKFRLASSGDNTPTLPAPCVITMSPARTRSLIIAGTPSVVSTKIGSTNPRVRMLRHRCLLSAPGIGSSPAL